MRGASPEHRSLRRCSHDHGADRGRRPWLRSRAGPRRDGTRRHARAARPDRRDAHGRVSARRRNDAGREGAAAMTIRVLVVDDHAVVRSGLRHILDSAEGIEVVGEAGDSQNAIFESRAQKPDVVLIDIVMPGKSGIETIPDLLKDAPDAKVLILSMEDDPHYVP